MTRRTPGTRRRVFALLAALGAIAWALPLHASAATTVVTIQFDDGTADQYVARQILVDHGMHATFYVNTGVIGDTPAAHMNWDQLTDLFNDGNEIAGHTLTHNNIKKLKYAPAHANVCQDRNNLLAHGFPATSFAYPFGSFNDRAEQVVHDCGYNSGRGVSGVDDRKTFAETVPPLDAYATRTPPNPKQGTTLATIEGYVMAAEANGGWVQLVFHHVCDQCDAYSITPDNLKLLLDWLQTQSGNGVVVMTTAQVIGGDVQPMVIP